jgi:hypothetical protein
MVFSTSTKGYYACPRHASPQRPWGAWWVGLTAGGEAGRRMAGVGGGGGQARTWSTRKAIIATRARQNRTRVARISTVMSRISYKGDDTATGRSGHQPSPYRVVGAGCASLSLTD